MIKELSLFILYWASQVLNRQWINPVILMGWLIRLYKLPSLKWPPLWILGAKLLPESRMLCMYVPHQNWFNHAIFQISCYCSQTLVPKNPMTSVKLQIKSVQLAPLLINNNLSEKLKELHIKNLTIWLDLK